MKTAVIRVWAQAYLREKIHNWRVFNGKVLAFCGDEVAT